VTHVALFCFALLEVVVLTGMLARAELCSIDSVRDRVIESLLFKKRKLCGRVHSAGTP
jgi:hypothetical protein